MANWIVFLWVARPAFKHYMNCRDKLPSTPQSSWLVGNIHDSHLMTNKSLFKPTISSGSHMAEEKLHGQWNNWNSYLKTNRNQHKKTNLILSKFTQKIEFNEIGSKNEGQGRGRIRTKYITFEISIAAAIWKHASNYGNKSVKISSYFIDTIAIRWIQFKKTEFVVYIQISPLFFVYIWTIK